MAADDFKIYGSLGQASNPLGQVPHGIGCPNVKVDPNPSGTFDPTTDMLIQDLLRGESNVNQEPTGAGVANALQVNFGAAQGSGGDPVMLLANGDIVCNQSGLYRLKIGVQIGRGTNSGTSIIIGRFTLNGLPSPRSIAAKISNSNEEQYTESDLWLNLTADDVVKVEIMRDLAGDNSGGLIAVLPTPEGGNEWTPAPSSLLTVSRWIPA